MEHRGEDVRLRHVLEVVDPDGRQIDRTVALERVEGNHELLADMVGLFVDEYPQLADALQAGLASGDLEQVASAAHQLKGNLATFAAKKGASAAAELEAMARSGDHRGAQEAWERFLEVFMRLEPELIALLAA